MSEELTENLYYFKEGLSMTEMQYRVLPRGGEKISVIGLGMGSIHEGSEEEIEKTLKLRRRI